MPIDQGGHYLKVETVLQEWVARPPLSEPIGGLAMHRMESILFLLDGCKSLRRGQEASSICRRPVSPDCCFPVDGFSGTAKLIESLRRL